MEGCVDRHGPIKELNEREKKSKPWITKDIIKLIKKRNQLLKNKKRKDDANTYRTYKLFRNKVNGEVKKSKKIIMLIILMSTIKHKHLGRYKKPDE